MTLLERKLKFLRRYRRTPYCELGRTVAGLDCWGFFAAYFREVHGIELPDPMQPAGPELEEALRRDLDWPEIKKPLPECGVFMRLAGVPHVAIYQQDGYFLHCARSVGVVSERLAGLLWERRIKGYYMHPSLLAGVRQ